MWPFNSDSSRDEEEEERAEEEEEERRRLLAIIMVTKTQKEKKFSDIMSEEGRRRCSRSLCRSVLLSNPQESPWQKLYSAGDDQVLINITGFDHKAFQTLPEYFEPLFLDYTPWTGRNDGRTMKRLPHKKKKGGPRIAGQESPGDLTINTDDSFCINQMLGDDSLIASCLHNKLHNGGFSSSYTTASCCRPC